MSLNGFKSLAFRRKQIEVCRSRDRKSSPLPTNRYSHFYKPFVELSRLTGKDYGEIVRIGFGEQGFGWDLMVERMVGVGDNHRGLHISGTIFEIG